MPTHFHLQIIPKPAGLVPFKNQQRLHATFRTILSSYTRAVNSERETRGSLFRAGTNYKPAYEDFIPADWEMGEDRLFTQLIPYIRICFDYIHNNPVKDGLVKEPTEWKWSSAREYADLQTPTICNRDLAKRIIGV